MKFIIIVKNLIHHSCSCSYAHGGSRLNNSDRLGQVARAVDVEAALHGNMVGQELERNDGQDALQAVDGLRDPEALLAQLGHLGIVLVANDDGVAAARMHLAERVQTLELARVVHDDHADGHVLVDHGERTMLQLARQDALRVHVGELLDLERALQARGEVEATAHDEQRLLGVQLVRNLLDLLVHGEHTLDLTGQLLQAQEDLLAALPLRDRVLAHDEREHDQRDELTGVGLGGGDADLGSGVDVNAAVGLARDRAAHRVGDADDERAALLAVSQRQDGVGRLARLRHKEADVVAEDGRVAVEEVAGQLDHHGQLGELFEELTRGERAVVAGAARDQHETTRALDLAQVVRNAAQCHAHVVQVAHVDTAAHGVQRRVRLLEDLLLHKVLVVALKN
jgi:hypothetical protein